MRGRRPITTRAQRRLGRDAGRLITGSESKACAKHGAGNFQMSPVDLLQVYRSGGVLDRAEINAPTGLEAAGCFGTLFLDDIWEDAD